MKTTRTYQNEFVIVLKPWDHSMITELDEIALHVNSEVFSALYVGFCDENTKMQLVLGLCSAIKYTCQNHHFG